PNLLIAGLAVAGLGFYILHLLADRANTVLTERATGSLLSRSRKIVLFPNQEELAKEAYQRVALALSSFAFLGLAVAGIALFYSSLAIVLIGYVVLATLIFISLDRVSAGFRTSLEKDLAGLVKVAANAGFYFAFLFLILDFVYGNPPGVI